MKQLEIFDIPSPCIGICESTIKGYCKGCFRNRNERLYWMTFNNEDKKKILTICKVRKIRYLKEKYLDKIRDNKVNHHSNLELFNENE